METAIPILFPGLPINQSLNTLNTERAQWAQPSQVDGDPKLSRLFSVNRSVSKKIRRTTYPSILWFVFPLHPQECVHLKILKKVWSIKAHRFQLPVTSASLVVTGALLVVTKSSSFVLGVLLRALSSRPRGRSVRRSQSPKRSPSRASCHNSKAFDARPSASVEVGHERVIFSWS